MVERADALIELGCEELPAGLQKTWQSALLPLLEKQLQQVSLSCQAVQLYISPRRVAVCLLGLATRQPDQAVVKQGPMLAQALDEAGEPTAAAQGFAARCQVPFTALAQEDTPKGKRLVYRDTQPGVTAAALLPTVLTDWLSEWPQGRTMRWGSTRQSFIRPVRWVVGVWAGQVLPGTLMGLPFGQVSWGHRVLRPAALTVTTPQHYAQQLREQGGVEPDWQARRARMVAEVHRVTDALGQPWLDEALLDEITGLVEWPVALVGRFAERFLALPDAVLFTVMKTQQKCIVVRDAKSGDCLPYFVCVANGAPADPHLIIAGNERVVAARLADAEFFYAQDRKTSLAARLPQLNDVVFQQQLGSLGAKTDRLQVLMQGIADAGHISAAQGVRAAQLAKCDGLTALVDEFPELAGTLGAHYAQLSGEPADVAQAIEAHLWPKAAQDPLPTGPLSVWLAVVDRVDTLVGFFGVGVQPTGEKDPYGLRRAAIGLLRLLIERSLPMPLTDLLAAAEAAYQAQQVALIPDVKVQVMRFILDRLKVWYGSQGIGQDVWAAVYAEPVGVTVLQDGQRRVQAVLAFLGHADAATLVNLNKRVTRILAKQADLPADLTYQAAFAQQAEEQALIAALEQAEADIAPALARQAYTAVWPVLTALHGVIDRFFQGVMVMADDVDLRRNRLAILQQTQRLLRCVADLSQLHESLPGATTVSSTAGT